MLAVNSLSIATSSSFSSLENEVASSLEQTAKDLFRIANSPEMSISLSERNNSFELSHGLNFSPDEDFQTKTGHGSPYHSENDYLYQSTLIKFLTDLFQDYQEFLNQDWVDFCENHYTIAYQAYQNEQIKNISDFDYGFLSNRDIAAFAILIRIAEYFQERPAPSPSTVFQAISPIPPSEIHRQQLSSEFLQNFQICVQDSLKPTTSNLTHLSSLLNTLIFSANQLSEMLLETLPSIQTFSLPVDDFFECNQENFSTSSKLPPLADREKSPIIRLKVALKNLSTIQNDPPLRIREALIQRNYTFLPSQGLNFDYDLVSKTMQMSGTPYHSEEDFYYQTSLTQFLALLLSYRFTGLNAHWIETCDSHYSIAFDAYLEAQGQFRSSSAASLTLLIRIAHFYIEVPELPIADDPASQLFQKKKNLANQLIASLNTTIQSLHELSSDEIPLREISAPLIAAGNLFSECFLDSPYGPLYTAKIEMHSHSLLKRQLNDSNSDQKGKIRIRP